MLNLSYSSNSITSLTLNLEFEETDGTISPIDLTNVKLTMTLKESLQDADPGVYQYSKTVHEGPTTGVSIFPIGIDITGLDSGDYYFDIKAVDSSTGEAYPVLSGNLNIYKGATEAYV